MGTESISSRLDLFTTHHADIGAGRYALLLALYPRHPSHASHADPEERKEKSVAPHNLASSDLWSRQHTELCIDEQRLTLEENLDRVTLLHVEVLRGLIVLDTRSIEEQSEF